MDFVQHGHKVRVTRGQDHDVDILSARLPHAGQGAQHVDSLLDRSTDWDLAAVDISRWPPSGVTLE